MAEEKVYKGALSLEVHDSIIYVTEGSGRVLHYLDPDNWDVEVKLTRKVKPIPDGTKVAKRGSSAFYCKDNGGWRFYLDPRYSGALAANQDDEWYRENTKPLVPGEWDTD